VPDREIRDSSRLSCEKTVRIEKDGIGSPAQRGIENQIYVTPRLYLIGPQVYSYGRGRALTLIPRNRVNPEHSDPGYAGGHLLQ
jgi:hypothetical protein